MYFLAQLRLGANGTGVPHHEPQRFEMMIDSGDGVWRNATADATDTAAQSAGWAVHSFQTTLGAGAAAGTARFGFGVTAAAVELGALVVARVGDDWSSLV